ncbi:MAG: glycerol-3-phosphate dehydrogenase/oxidase [Thermoplasmata archaeon]
MNDEIIKIRKEKIERLKKGVDILIIGGGITGSGILNALSSITNNVAVVEANDFAFGTSSRSSKLIHGGLRYLANGQFSVVINSVRERDFLLKYDHLIKKEYFLIPLDDYSWSKFSLKIGLFIYSFFSKNIKAKWFSKSKISEIYPYLKYTPQRGGYIYAEGVVDDSRLVIENIMSAIQNNAIALNYAEVLSINFSDKKAREALIKDKITGEQFIVPFKILVNAAGPWVGNIFEMIKKEFKKIENLNNLLKLSKGDHIIVNKELFPVNIALAIRSPIDKRQVFIIPREETVIIGTTETYFKGDISNPKPSEEEINYLIESVKRYIKDLKRNDIINAYSGIRPLFGKGEKLGKISREYKIVRCNNIINVLGGKITTYRTISLKVSKIIMRELNIKEKPTLNLAYIKKFTEIKDELKNKYNLKNDLQALFAYDILYESAFHIDDILWRREGFFIFSKDAGISKIDDVILSLKNILGKDDKELEEERKKYLDSVYR